MLTSPIDGSEFSMGKTMRVKRWVVLPLSAAAFVMSAASAADAASLSVVNNTSSSVTVSVDGNYGCNTAGQTTCVIPTTVGQHRLRAVRTDNNQAVESDHNIPAEGLT